MARVTGVDAVVKRLYTKRGEIATGVERGLVKAGLFLLREAQILVPIDTGALRNSGFVRKTGSGFSADVQVGFTQSYGLFVHEDLTARHAQGKQAKFLEQPAREKRPQMIAIIRSEARVR